MIFKKQELSITTEADGLWRQKSVDTHIEEVPDDFRVTLYCQSASMPPPDNYRYEIMLGPGNAGSMSLRPDYPDPLSSPWQETFTITSSQLQALHASFVKSGLFHRDWPELISPSPVGGSIRWLEGIRSGIHFSIPENLSNEDKTAARYLFEAIEQMVSASLRKNLEKRRLAWIKKYGSV